MEKEEMGEREKMKGGRKEGKKIGGLLRKQ